MDKLKMDSNETMFCGKGIAGKVNDCIDEVNMCINILSPIVIDTMEITKTVGISPTGDKCDFCPLLDKLDHDLNGLYGSLQFLVSISDKIKTGLF